ncbi:MAG: Hint domain-containing protein [Paracoccaceae bacterium]
MNTPLPAAARAVSKTSVSSSLTIAKAPGSAPRRAMPLMRNYTVQVLRADGTIDDFTRIAPAQPIFEEAFSAVARGTLIATPEGQVAIEDLRPGMKVITLENGVETLPWIGSIARYPIPAHDNRPDLVPLTRVTAEALGYARPAADLMVGPGARMLMRNLRGDGMAGDRKVFGQVRALEDGFGVFRVTPASAVTLYHLAFKGQRTIIANGVELESYHPGAAAKTFAQPNVLPLFKSLFPHVDGLADFGPQTHQRLSAMDAENLMAV